MLPVLGRGRPGVPPVVGGLRRLAPRRGLAARIAAVLRRLAIAVVRIVWGSAGTVVTCHGFRC